MNVFKTKRVVVKAFLLMLGLVVLLGSTGCAGFRGTMPLVATSDFDIGRMAEYEVLELDTLTKRRYSEAAFTIPIPFTRLNRFEPGPIEKVVARSLKDIPGAVAIVDAEYFVTGFSLPLFFKSGYFRFRGGTVLVEPNRIETAER